MESSYNRSQINSTKLINENEINLPITTFIYSLAVALTSIFVLSIALNMLTTITIIVAKVFTPINLLIMNLAVADLTYTLGIPMFIVHTFMKNWPFGELGCKLFYCTEFMGIAVSVSTVTALSVERYFEIVDKKKRASQISIKFKNMIVVAFCAFSWLVALFVTIPFIDSIKQVEAIKDNFACDTKWSEKTITIYFAFKFVFVFLVPYIVILISSAKLLLFLAAWKRQRSSRLFASKASSAKPAKNLKTSQSSLSKMHYHKQRTRNYSASEEITDVGSSFLLNASETKVSHLKTLHHISSTSSITIEFKAANDCPPPLQSSSKASPPSFSVHYKTPAAEASVGSQCLRIRTPLKTNHIANVRQKASCLVLVIILLFLLQWSPLCIFQLLMLITDINIPNIHLVNLIVSTLSYSNTVANPILYMLLTYNFKLYFKKTVNTKRAIQNNLFSLRISNPKTSVQNA